MKRKIFTYLSLTIAAVMLMFQNVTAVYAYDKPELKSASISKYGIYGIDASGKIFYWQYADDLAKQVMPDVKNSMHVEAADTRSDLGTRYLIGEYALTSDGQPFKPMLTDYMKSGSNQTNTPAIAVSPIKLIFNGEELKTDVAPIIENGRTYLPARVLYDAINNEDPADEYRIEWNEKDKTIKIISVYDYLLHPEIATNFTVGSKTVTVSYGDVTNKFEMTDPVIIRNNRALIPLGAVAEMLECEVNWDENARTVNIKYDVFGGMEG